MLENLKTTREKCFSLNTRSSHRVAEINLTKTTQLLKFTKSCKIHLIHTIQLRKSNLMNPLFNTEWRWRGENILNWFYLWWNRLKHIRENSRTIWQLTKLYIKTSTHEIHQHMEVVALSQVKQDFLLGFTFTRVAK